MKENNEAMNAMSNTEFKPGDKVKCIDNGGMEEYLMIDNVYTVGTLSSDGYPRINSIFCNPDRFELIEKGITMEQTKQPMRKLGEKKFNPQPGDKIICNNGEEFLCCTLEFLQDKVSPKINTSKPILGYSYITGWQGWDAYGYAPNKYSIKKVISKQENEIQSATLYSAEDIQKACIDNLGWHEDTIKLLMKSLEKVTHPEYMEYLRLKDMFESDKE